MFLKVKQNEKAVFSCPVCHHNSSLEPKYQIHVRSLYNSARSNDNPALVTCEQFPYSVQSNTIVCHNCDWPTIVLYKFRYNADEGEDELVEEKLLVPESCNRDVNLTHVPPNIQKEYVEACKLLTINTNTSAVYSRRCLQLLIREHFEIIKKNLYQKIEVLTEVSSLPSDLIEDLHTFIRDTGNWGAHPKKYENVDTIVDVEPDEAECALEVLENLFDFGYTQPAKRMARKNKLAEKKQTISLSL